MYQCLDCDRTFVTEQELCPYCASEDIVEVDDEKEEE